MPVKKAPQGAQADDFDDDNPVNVPQLMKMLQGRDSPSSTLTSPINLVKFLQYYKLLLDSMKIDLEHLHPIIAPLIVEAVTIIAMKTQISLWFLIHDNAYPTTWDLLQKLIIDTCFPTEQSKVNVADTFRSTSQLTNSEEILHYVELANTAIKLEALTEKEALKSLSRLIVSSQTPVFAILRSSVSTVAPTEFYKFVDKVHAAIIFAEHNQTSEATASSFYTTTSRPVGGSAPAKSHSTAARVPAVPPRPPRLPAPITVAPAITSKPKPGTVQFSPRHCTFCDKMGHEFQECWKRIKESNPQAHLLRSQASDNNEFHLDTCSNVHVVNDEKLLGSSCVPHDQVVGTSDANGNPLMATSIGSVVMDITTPTAVVRARLRGVLFSKDAAVNIISPSKLLEDMPGVSITVAAQSFITFPGPEVPTLQLEQRNGLLAFPSGADVLKVVVNNRLYLPKSLSPTASLSNAPISPTVMVQTSARPTLSVKEVTLLHRQRNHISLDILVESLRALGHHVPEAARTAHCEVCALAKAKRASIVDHSADHPANHPGDVIDSDLLGPLNPSENDGYLFALSFIDRNTKYAVFHPLKKKSDTLSALQSYVRHIATTDITFGPGSLLHTDNDAVYTDRKFVDYVASLGIKLSHSPPYTPSQNGFAERYWGTIANDARALLTDAKFGPTKWLLAFNHAVFVRNLLPHKANPGNLSPFEMVTGKSPEELLSRLRVFGSPAFYIDEKPTRTKLQPKSLQGIYVGYNPANNSHMILSRDTSRVIHSANVTFHEQAPLSGTPSSASVVSAPTLPLVPTPESPPPAPQSVVETSSRRATALITTVATSASPVVIPSAPMAEFQSTASTRKDPGSMKDVLTSPDSQAWLDSIDAEMCSIAANGTMTEVSRRDIPPGSHILHTKWVFKTKTDENSTRKSRLVALGNLQVPDVDVDLDSLHASVVQLTSFRAMMAHVAVDLDWDITHVDFSSAFLNASLPDDVFIYITLPVDPRFPNAPRTVYRLLKALYGLRQAPRLWSDHLTAALLEYGLKRSLHDPSVYYNENLALAVWVDDMPVCTPPSSPELENLLSFLRSKFKITFLGEIKKFAGIEVARDRIARSISLTQTAYIDSILERFVLSACNSMPTPATPNSVLEPASEDELLPEDNRFREMIGCLQFLCTCTRADIADTVAKLARYQSRPGITHLTAAKHCLRYLKGTRTLGLTFSPTPSPLHAFCDSHLHAYADANWGADALSARSTSANVIIFHNAAVSWLSKLQETCAQSTAEAEYVSLALAAIDLLFVKNLLNEVFFSFRPGAITQPLVIYEDNTAAIHMSLNHVSSRRTRHINIKYHTIRENVASKQVRIVHIESKRNVADHLTKPLAKAAFQALRDIALGPRLR